MLPSLAAARRHPIRDLVCTRIRSTRNLSPRIERAQRLWYTGAVRRSGRVVEGGTLLRCYTSLTGYRGFESLLLRSSLRSSQHARFAGFQHAALLAAFSFLAWGLELLYEGREHALYLLCISGEGLVRAGAEEIEIVGQEQVVFELAARAHRHQHEAPQFGVATSSATFRDIGRNRRRTPTKLRHQAVSLLPRKPPGSPVHVQHEAMTLLPSSNTPKISHATILGHPPEELKPQPSQRV